jgi:hypothetical protein
MIDELEVQRYDKMFGTKSKCFPETNTIIVYTPLDEWKIQISNKKQKGIYLYHQNKRKDCSKYHLQGNRSTLLQTYHSIYTHKKCLPIVLRHSGNIC